MTVAAELLSSPIVWLILALALTTYSLLLTALFSPQENDAASAPGTTWSEALPSLLSALPLLGLLGTIVGLLQTFSQMAKGSLDLQQLLSGGIADALFTTQVGLVTVIPGWLMWALVKRKWHRQGHRLGHVHAQ